MSRPRRLTLESLENRTVPATALTDAIVPENNNTAADTQQTAATSTNTDVELQYVQRIYADLLGRNIDAGAHAYVDALHTGAMNRHDVAESVLHSDEYGSRQINGMFQTFLGRAADDAALNGYLDELHHGATIQAIGVDILSSGEYQAKHAGGDAFLTSVYHDLLGRDLDATATASYGTRYTSDPTQAHAIVDEIMNSTEMRQRTGEAIISLMLDSAPIPGIPNKYVTESINGTPMDSIISEIAATASYSDIGRSASTFLPGQPNVSY